MCLTRTSWPSNNLVGIVLTIQVGRLCMTCLQYVFANTIFEFWTSVQQIFQRRVHKGLSTVLSNQKIDAFELCLLWIVQLVLVLWYVHTTRTRQQHHIFRR